MGRPISIKTRLLARCVLPDRSEFRCLVRGISVDLLVLDCPQQEAVGSKIALYLDQTGRLDGTIASTHVGGFSVTLAAATDVPVKHVGDILARLSSKRLTPIPERRAEPRISVNGVGLSDVALPRLPYRVLNLSANGAELAVDGSVHAVGSAIQIGNMRAKVVRRSRAGVGVTFIDTESEPKLLDRLAELGLAE